MELQRAVHDHGSERYAKGFSSGDQFVAMSFCQLAQAHSLRDICGGLASCLGKIVHPGSWEAPERSTLAYANAHRPWELLETAFHQLLGEVSGRSPRVAPSRRT